MLPRHTARAIVIHNNQLLLIERWRPGLHYFSIPGGGIEPGEQAEQTAVRELLEETGCVVQLERQVYLLKLPDGSEHNIFLARYVSGEPHLPADSPEALHTTSDNRFKPRWVALDSLAKASFLIWKPIQRQLVRDLADGFSPELRVLAPEA
jgi:8-oxo-dGTP pyrophosphatase MutT (NUDIX family)